MTESEALTWSTSRQAVQAAVLLASIPSGIRLIAPDDVAVCCRPAAVA